MSEFPEYKAAEALDIRDLYAKIGQTRDKRSWTDAEVVQMLETLDRTIGFLDGISGTSNLTSYALIVIHQNFLGMARLRGLVKES